MTGITIIIHSYSSPGLISSIKSALLVTKNVIIIGEEKRDDVKKYIAERKIRIVPFSNYGIVEPARTFGIKQAQTPWVFLLDADEQITPELAREIKVKIKDISFGLYQTPRKEILFHHYWLKFGGWYPNFQTRLIQTAKFVSWPSQIHATPVIKGKKGFFENPLLHYSQNDFSEIVERTIVFENYEADLLFKAGHQVSTGIFFRKYFGELFRRIIKWQGFRDGTIGIIESIYQAFSKTITYIFLYEKKYHSKPRTYS